MTPPDMEMSGTSYIRKDWHEELVELTKNRFVRKKRKQLQYSKPACAERADRKKEEPKGLANENKANYRRYEATDI